MRMALPLRYISLGFVVAVVGGLLSVLAYGMAAGRGSEGRTGAFPVRERPAPDFTLNLFDGGKLTLSELKGRAVIINFWASWCKACKEEAPVLEAGWQKYREKGVVFIGLNFRDNEADARAHIKEFGKTYPIGPDPGNLSVDYGVLGVPETFFINREGVIVGRWIGALNKEKLEAYVEDLLR